MHLTRIFAVTLAAMFGIGAPAAAQPAKSLRAQLVGTWNFVIAEITTADGKKTLPFGDKPKGLLVFTEDGYFSQVHISSGLPRIESNNRLAGTDADNRAIVQGTLALFGTYTVDEAKRTLTFNITASTFPNQEGTSQTRTIDKLTADEFGNTNPAASRDGPAVAANYYTRAKAK